MTPYDRKEIPEEDLNDFVHELLILYMNKEALKEDFILNDIIAKLNNMYFTLKDRGVLIKKMLEVKNEND